MEVCCCHFGSKRMRQNRDSQASDKRCDIFSFQNQQSQSSQFTQNTSFYQSIRRCIGQGHTEQEQVRIDLMIVFMIDFYSLFQHFERSSCYIESQSSGVATDLYIEVRNMGCSSHKRFQDCYSFAVGWAVLTLLIKFGVELLGNVFDFHFNNDNNKPNMLYCQEYNYSMDGGYCGRFYEWIINSIDYFILQNMREHQQSELLGFLQAQNKTLREQNKEFKSLITLNREALKIALSPRTNQEHLSALVNLLFEQNSKLIEKNRLLRDEIQTKTCQMLITEQIASASNDHQRYVTTQLKERLKVLKKQLEVKDSRIVELTKQLGKPQNSSIGGQNQIGSVVVEYTEINKITEKMFKEAQNLRREIDAKGNEIQRLKQQKQQLLKLNLILTKQVNELKAYSLQTTSSIKRQFNTSQTDLSKFLKYQSKIATGSDDESDQHEQSNSEEDHSESSELDQILDQDDDFQEQKIEEPKMKPKISLALNLNKNQSESHEKPSVVPKLELKKARQIQSLIIKKINNDQKKKQGNLNKDDKYRKYQLQSEDLRKRLGNQIILKLRFQRQNSFLKKFIAELQQRNQLLLRDKQEKIMEQDYEKKRHQHEIENVETLLDICRDVTMNERLKAVCKGHQKLLRKDLYSNQV